MTGLFITGTDTGIGKTHVACAIVTALNLRGLRTTVMKPVVSGCQPTEQGLQNEDALALMSAASIHQSYDDVNPYAFEPAIAPHIAAQMAGVRVELDEIKRHYRNNLLHSDVCIVEAVGGWMVPLNEEETVADLAAELQIPIVVVVGIRLGCINHALLTIEQIEREDLPILGWVANSMDPDMLMQKENIEALQQRIPYPLMGTLPYSPEASFISLSQKLNIKI